MPLRFLIVVLAILVLVSVSALWFISPMTFSPAGNTGDDTSPAGEAETLIARHQFLDGLHTFEGEIVVPTPCHTLRSQVQVRESFPEQAVLLFETLTEAEVCAQVLTPQSFHISFRASEGAIVSATLNGKRLNVVVEEIAHVGEL